MTTNSFGTSPLPKYDYEPVFTKAARGSGLPMGAKVAAVAAATGLAYYATSKQGHNHKEHQFNQQPSSSYGGTTGERQFLPQRLSDTMKKRQK